VPVLLLCYGEPTAKDLLRRTIEARYGASPPVFDSLRIEFKGKARVKVGPIMAWVPLNVTARFSFPLQMRWDFVAKPLKLPVQRGIEALDNDCYRSMRRGKAPQLIEDAALVVSARRRLWAIASTLLTPISDMHIKLSTLGEHSFEALNTQLDDAAQLYLREDYTLDYVQVRCHNPDTGSVQDFKLQMSTEQTLIGELMLPGKISVSWDGEPSFEIEPIEVEMNPKLPDLLFQLED